ncbi:MAG: hypothetical protein ACPGSM_01145 [Thiolinea sp.]
MHRPFAHYLISACLLVVTTCSQAAEWKVVMNKSGVNVQQQSTASGYAITRGSIEINTTLPVLATILQSPKISKDLIHMCRDGWMVKKYDKANRLDYLIIDAPLMFEDRDIYVHSHSSWNAATKTVLIRMSGREKHDAGQPGRVRIKDFQGYWRLQQTTPDKVMVTYQVYNDPQIPGGSFLSFAFADSAFQTLLNLEKLSKNPKYQTNISIEELVAAQ